MAIHGALKYGPDFTHFEYTNPEAPKGGEIRRAVVSSSGFDSLNPFVVKGAADPYIAMYVYESLTSQSYDEPASSYGLIAEMMEIPKDRSWVIFHINPKARFHDGHPITSEDVAFSFDLLTTQGSPIFAAYYQDINPPIILDEHRIKFTFKSLENKELPMIIGDLYVLPKHFWDDKEFNKSSLEIPLGSGPYRVKSVDPGNTIVYERVEDYWGRDLPVNRGQYNFDRIQFEYFRDSDVALEAFKSGDYDVREEYSAKNWATQYEGKRFESGDIVKEEIPHERPARMQGFAMNLRKPLFSDVRVREALAYAFDFEWMNKNLFYGSYVRTRSYFGNTELEASSLPSAEELEILKPFRDQLPPELFTTVFRPPESQGNGNIRSNLRKARNLLKDAGWVIRNNALTNTATGEVMKFEIMIRQSSFQKVVLPFSKNLERLGIEVDVRLVDTQQYITRLNEFDYDMYVAIFQQSNSPGNEQRNYWHSESADREGSRNTIGIKNPIIDKLIDLVIAAPDREQLVHRTRALDRVLLFNHYTIPHWHVRHFRVAYWNKYEHPKITPKILIGLDTWWQKAN